MSAHPKPPRHIRPTVPFNLSRWFGIVGFVSIAIVSAASSLLLSHFLTERMLRQEGVLTMEFVQSVVLAEKSLRGYFTGDRAQDAAALEAALGHIASMPDVLRANIYNGERSLIWSSDDKIIGRHFGSNPELDAALAGKLVVHGDADSNHEQPRKDEHVDLRDHSGYFVEIYVPVRDAPRGRVIGAVELYKNPQALAEALSTGRLFTFIGAAAVGLFLYLTLFGLTRRADAVIRQQQDRLVETEILATVGEMGSAVAHGIRNPLAAIRSSAELVLEGTPETARESAQDIIAESDRLEEWVRNLLSYTRPLSDDAGAVALRAIITGTMDHFAREMEKRGISARLNVAEDLPMAKGDPLLLRQVLHSLMANAVEAIQQSGTIEIAGITDPAKRRVELTIRDSGPGMSPEQLKRIFTPFYTTKTRGMGVGLALAKRIVERFGGRIAIDSAPGRGTAVCLSMPIA
ncbi:MAG: two-component sensor histidine kinase [Betaproteobacteria bacterium]|nr:two-component sensor histidine kinase [Betaproteobacteria bacterium]